MDGGIILFSDIPSDCREPISSCLDVKMQTYKVAEVLNNFVIHFHQKFATVKNTIIIYQTFC